MLLIPYGLNIHTTQHNTVKKSATEVRGNRPLIDKDSASFFTDSCDH